jgi:hypothetical protein
MVSARWPSRVFFADWKKNYRLYLPETKALIMFTNWAVINHHVSWKSFSDMGSHRSSGRTEAGWLWLLGSLSYERFLHMRIYRWWFKQFIYRWYVFLTISQPRLIFLLLKTTTTGIQEPTLSIDRWWLEILHVWPPLRQFRSSWSGRGVYPWYV